jgi:hypothetical protein
MHVKLLDRLNTVVFEGDIEPNNPNPQTVVFSHVSVVRVFALESADDTATIYRESSSYFVIQ